MHHSSPENSPDGDNSLQIRNITFALLFVAIVATFFFKVEARPDVKVLEKIEQQNQRLTIRMLIYQALWSKSVEPAQQGDIKSTLENQIQLIEVRSDIFKGLDKIYSYVIRDYLELEYQLKLKPDERKEQLAIDFINLYEKGRLLDKDSPLLTSVVGDLVRIKQLQIKQENEAAARLESELAAGFVTLLGSISFGMIAITIANLIFIFRFRTHKPLPRFILLISEIPAASRRALVETPILFIFLMLAVGGVLLRPLLPELSNLEYSVLVQPLLFLVALYYFYTHVTEKQLLKDLTHQGSLVDVGREIGWGVMGFIVIFPFGLMTAFFTMMFMGGSGGGDNPLSGAHPIIFEIEENPTLVFVMAVIMAPIIEEIIFRNFLYGYFRGHLGILPAALLNGFCFAILHPQGVFALPYLIALGAGLCILREFRSSVVAPIVTHMMVNGLATTLIFKLLV